MQPIRNESNGGGESMLTLADLQHAMNACSQGPRDPLADYPLLGHTARSICTVMGLDLARRGVAGELAAHIADSAYRLAAVAALAMRHAIWREVLEGRTDEAA